MNKPFDQAYQQAVRPISFTTNEYWSALARIAVITSGLTGMLYSSFEIVARLERAGHDVIYASPQNVGERVRAQGIAYHQLPEVAFDPAPKVPPGLGRLNRLIRVWASAGARRRAAIQHLRMEAFQEFLEEQTPDLLLIDMELLEHVITAAVRPVPLLLIDQMIPGWRRPGLPPLPTGIIPGQGQGGSRRSIARAWWRLRLRRWISIQSNRWRSGFTDRRSVLRAYARQVGFPQRFLQAYQWPPPFTFDRLPVISLTSYELDFPHAPRPNLHYVGPMVYTQRKDSPADAPSSEQLEPLFSRRRELKKRLLYGALTTMAADRDEPFLKKLFEAVAGQSDWWLIIGLGGRLDPSALGSIPDNVFTFGWVPQLQVLEQADAAIIHGGINTINECIHYRVPMLVYSGKKYDQNGNAARIGYHGYGLRGDRDRDRPGDIQEKIYHLLEAPNFRKRVDYLHECYRRDQPTLIELVSKMLQRPTTKTASWTGK